MKVDFPGSGSYPEVNFGISSVEISMVCFNTSMNSILWEI
jgi:hypothetical protein